jgi:MarR-like DNA-binding transcriptional regulator SgrR of sgrS sRNA
VGAARRLAASRRARAVVYTWKDSYASAFNRVLTNQLAAIGIEVTIRTMTNDDFANGTVGAKASRSDLVWSGFNAETSDPVAYLQQLFLPPADRTALERIAGLPAPERDRQAAALARKVERESLVVPYDIGAIPELVSSRLGCMVHQPELAGIDLAALCLRHT